MSSQINRRVVMALSLAILLAVAIIPKSTALAAQEFEISRFNISNFPKITFFCNLKGVKIERKLKENNFSLKELEEKQKIQNVSKLGEQWQPVNIVLALDLSGSMDESLDELRASVKEFINQARPYDNIALIGFQENSIRVLQDFTSDKKKLTNDLQQVSSGGDTPLFDATIKSVDLAKGKQNSFVIILTDGEDTNSGHSDKDAINYAKGATNVFTIGLGDVKEQVLKNIARETGGSFLKAPSASDLQRVYNNLHGTISNQLKVTYKSSNLDRSIAKREVQVKLNLQNGNFEDSSYYVLGPPSIELPFEYYEEDSTIKVRGRLGQIVGSEWKPAKNEKGSLTIYEGGTKLNSIGVKTNSSGEYSLNLSELNLGKGNYTVEVSFSTGPAEIVNRQRLKIVSSLPETAAELASADKFDLAEELYKRAISSSSGDKKVKLLRALTDLYVDNEVITKAAETLNRLSELKPEDVSILVRSAKLWNQAEAYHKAETALLKAKELSPKDPDILYDLSSVQTKLGELGSALENIEKVEKTSPDDPQIRILKGEILVEMGQIEDAIEYIEDAVALAPKDVDILRAASKLLFQVNKYEKALDQLEKAKSLQPENVDLQKQFVKALKGQGNLEKALKEINSILNKKDLTQLQALDIKMLKGNILDELGNVDKALNIFEDIQKIKPEDPDINKGILELNDKLGNSQKKEKTLQKLKRIDSSRTPDIKILNPLKGTETTSSETILRALIRDNVGLMKIEVNTPTSEKTYKYPFAQKNRTFFTLDVPLREGKNTVEIQAFDGAGNTTSEEVSINAQPGLEQNSSVDFVNSEGDLVDSYVQSENLIYALVRDRSQNSDPQTKERIPPRFVYLFTNNGKRAFHSPLQETGKNTGRFKSSPIGLNRFNLDSAKKLKVVYQDPGNLMDTSSESISINPSTESTSKLIGPKGEVKEVFQRGDTIYGQVKDPDENYQTAEREEVKAKIKIGPFENPQLETGISLKETGQDTGVFRAEIKELDKLVSTRKKQLNLYYQDDDDPNDKTISTSLLRKSSKNRIRVIKKDDKKPPAINLGKPLPSIIVKDADMNRNKDVVDTIKEALIVVNLDNGRLVRLPLNEVSSSGAKTKKDSGYFAPLEGSLKAAFNTLLVEDRTKLKFFYEDPLDRNEVSSLTAVVVKSTESKLTTASGASNYDLGQEVTVVLKDTDQNRLPGKIETVEISVSSLGEKKKLTLKETGPDSGTFKSNPQKISINKNTNKLKASNRSKIEFHYQDPTSPSDKGSFSIRVFKPTESHMWISSIKEKERANFYAEDRIKVGIVDQDENKKVNKPEEITITVTTLVHEESLTLTETGPNTGRFVSPEIALGRKDGILGLELTGGESITFSYEDPTNSADVSSEIIELKSKSRLEFVEDEENIIHKFSLAEKNSQLRVKVFDPDENQNRNSKESLSEAVFLVAPNTNSFTKLSLTETEKNSGVFISERIKPTLSCEGGDIQVKGGGTLRATYNDPDDAHDSSVARLNIRPTVGETKLVNPAGIKVDSYAVGETVLVKVIDADQNKDKDTVDIIKGKLEIRSSLSQVTTILREIGPDQGVFISDLNPTTKKIEGIQTSRPYKGGDLEVSPGDYILAKYSDPNCLGTCPSGDSAKITE